MQRRKFLVLSALSLVAVSNPFLSCNATDTELDKKLALPQILSRLTDEKEIKSIGKEYGKAYPGDYSLKKLENELKENGNTSFSSKTPAKDIYASLDATIHNNFDVGNTVIVNGWVLSIIEARQCAMASLV